MYGRLTKNTMAIIMEKQIVCLSAIENVVSIKKKGLDKLNF